MAAKPTPLSAAKYKVLLRDIRDFVSESLAKEHDRKIDAYWHIGQRIEEEALAQDVGYYSLVIKDLARDLGVATRTLYDAVQFADVYKEPTESPALTWSHHRVLLRLGTKKDRSSQLRRNSIGADPPNRSSSSFAPTRGVALKPQRPWPALQSRIRSFLTTFLREAS
jgi:hypothetical protein